MFTPVGIIIGLLVIAYGWLVVSLIKVARINTGDSSESLEAFNVRLNKCSYWPYYDLLRLIQVIKSNLPLKRK